MSEKETKAPLARQRVLGKGLGALIQGAEEAGRLGDKAVRLVPLDSIATNPRQPRKSFDDEALQELAASIRQVGVLQPVLLRRLRPSPAGGAPGSEVRGTAAAGAQAASRRAAAIDAAATTARQDATAPAASGTALAKGTAVAAAKGAVAAPAPAPAGRPEFLLVAGERRVRAARLAGLREIPAIICSYEETEALRVALLENIQREDLGPLEEAAAYRDLQDAYGATQDEIAGMLGKRRSTVANALRLLALEPELQQMVVAGELSRGHAKALLGLADSESRLRLGRLCRTRGLSVRECERRVQVLAARGGRAAPARPRAGRRAAAEESPALRALRERAERALGAPVHLERDERSGKGRIEIRFFDDDDLERLLQALGVDTNLD